MAYPIERIAVVGATGMLGVPVTRALAEAGFAVTAVVRTPNSAKNKMPEAVKLVQGDVERPATITAALKGMDAVYISLEVSPAQKKDGFWTVSKGVAAIVAACRTVGVKRVFFLASQMQKNSTMDWWVLQMKREAVTTLKRSGLDYTIFYPANFMESLPVRMRQGKRIVLAGRPIEGSFWIAAKDYAAEVVEAVRKAEPGVNKEYSVQGPESFTAKQAAQTFVKNYQGGPLSVAGAPLAIFKFLGLFSPTMDYVRHISEALNKTPESFDAEKTWVELGKPKTTLAQFARETKL